ncbi:MAG: hypothetical protein ABI588_10800 [Arenimonas sp.]
MATKKPTEAGDAPAASETTDGRGGFSVSADKHQLMVQAQREFIDSIADRVEKGEPFERAGERKLVAGMLRAWAKQIPDALPDSRSGAARINPGYVAIHFACLVNGQGRSKSTATAELAEIYNVSAEAISEAIAKFEGPAMRLVPRKGDASRK